MAGHTGLAGNTWSCHEAAQRLRALVGCSQLQLLQLCSNMSCAGAHVAYAKHRVFISWCLQQPYDHKKLSSVGGQPDLQQLCSRTEWPPLCAVTGLQKSEFMCILQIYVHLFGSTLLHSSFDMRHVHRTIHLGRLCGVQAASGLGGSVSVPSSEIVTASSVRLPHQWAMASLLQELLLCRADVSIGNYTC
jgi:hypothetical protein